MSVVVPASWGDLDREFARWREADRPATLWWRDDDAVAATPALDRLLDIAERHGLPVALAVIPAMAEPGLAERLADHAADGSGSSPRRIAVLQHGYAHRNHAPAGEKKAELGPHRPAGAVLAELARGRSRLNDLFAAGDVALPPVLVPPWNRIAGEVTRRLPEAGFAGLSTHAPRAAPLAAPGLAQVNTHADIIDWHGHRGFVGEGLALGRIVAHLAARRTGTVDADEPTGIMTHHLAHDDGCWDFMAQLAARTAKVAAAVWLDAPTIFNMPAIGRLP